MAISVNWPTGVITIPQADCALVNGTFYTLDTNVARLAIKALEDDSEGMPYTKTHSHNTEVTISGTTYYRTIRILAPYKIQFMPDELWTVQLTGSNNNMWSVGDGILVQNNVQVIPTNTAGGQIISVGSGLSDSQDTQLMSLVNGLTTAQETLLDELHKLQGLDASNPMTVTPTSREAGSVEQVISGNGETSTTVTRQP